MIFKQSSFGIESWLFSFSVGELNEIFI